MVALQALILALLCSLGACGMLADTILLRPPRARSSTGERERVLVPTPRGDVEVFVIRAVTEPSLYVIRFYGNAELSNDSAPFEATAYGTGNLELWGVNYLGYGGSGGKATLENVALSARAVYDAVAKRANGKPIIAIGSSMGAAASLHLAAVRPLTAVVLVNPPPLRELVLRHALWNGGLLASPIAASIPAVIDSIANAHRATAPALFIRSRRDRIVPPGYQQRVIDQYAGPKRVLEVDAGHNNALTDEVVREIYELVKRVLLRQAIAQRRDMALPDLELRALAP